MNIKTIILTLAITSLYATPTQQQQNFITIREHPTITNTVTPLTATEGDSFTLTCTVSGLAPLNATTVGIGILPVTPDTDTPWCTVTPEARWITHEPTQDTAVFQAVVQVFEEVDTVTVIQKLQFRVESYNPTDGYLMDLDSWVVSFTVTDSAYVPETDDDGGGCALGVAPSTVGLLFLLLALLCSRAVFFTKAT